MLLFPDSLAAKHRTVNATSLVRFQLREPLFLNKNLFFILSFLKIQKFQI